MSGTDWEDIQPRFRREVLRRGVTTMSRDLPASRMSVYRWIEGQARPCRPALRRITEILNKNEED